MDIEEIATQIVDAAIKVHRALGPGLLESAYIMDGKNWTRNRPELRYNTGHAQTLH